MVRAREKENKTNQAREWDRATREPDNGTKRAGQRGARESDNETKRDEQRNKEDGQVSEGVEHPLTFGSYINNQIGK